MLYKTSLLSTTYTNTENGCLIKKKPQGSQQTVTTPENACF